MPNVNYLNRMHRENALPQMCEEDGVRVGTTCCLEVRRRLHVCQKRANKQNEATNSNNRVTETTTSQSNGTTTTPNHRHKR